jgi:hypothetical protein
VTNTSVTSASPQWVAGSNVLTSIRAQAERRPGWPTALEASPISLGAGETIKRTCTWSKWSGQYYAMYFTVDATKSYIYKLAIGSDTTAVKLFTSSSTTPFWYQTANDTIYMGNGTDMVKFRATSTSDTVIYKWGITAPTIAPTVSTTGTGIDAQTGYYYVCTYWNDNAKHESSPSPVSACTGKFTNKTVSVGYTDGNDAATGITNQITHVKIYRTTDGGSTNTTKMQLVVKQAVGSSTYSDSTADTSLGTEFAPEQYRNDPPPTANVGAYSQGRIALFVSGSLWLTGYELVSKGVPEESVFGASLGVLGGGDVWNYDRPVKAVASTDEGFVIYMPLRIDALIGDSADTFRRVNLLRGRGTTKDTNVAQYGSDIAWFDTSGQVWHSKLGEIGQDIRPTIASIDQSKSMVSIHISGIYHHIYLLDGANGKIYAFDLDTNIWMVPWSVGTTASGLWSGETASGTVDCLLARNGTKVLKQSKTNYQDDGNTYTASANLGLVHISQTTQLTEKYDKSNPQWRGVIDNIEIKTNSVLPTDVKVLLDDDPAQATGVSVNSGQRNIDDAVQGTYLRQVRYPLGTLLEDGGKSSKGRFASVEIDWAAATSNFVLEYLDIAFYPHAV